MDELLRADGVLSKSRLAEIQALMRQLAASDPLDAEVAYVDLFDRGRATSLYLFEHVHGDSRDRGPAMIDLGETYAKAGLLLDPSELPDYLPVVLEFAATQPPATAREFLREIAHLLNAIFSALQQRGTLYAAAPAAILDLAGQKAQPVEVHGDPALDESWTEPAAFAGCSREGQARPGEPQPVRIVRNTPNPASGVPQ
jgi:nitrate reductase molybdenum cofactor assembly chaperone NarJ/NarW